MNIDLLYQTIRGAKVVLFGERHNYVGDTAMVLTLANKFLAAGKHLSFYMEHFPGEETNTALQRALGTQTPPGDWSSIHQFLHTPVTIMGEQQSPSAAWGHPEQEMKLKTLLRFAQLHGIPVKGHDLDFAIQDRNNSASHAERTYTAQVRTPNVHPRNWPKVQRTRSQFEYSKDRRDTWMSLHCLSFARNTKDDAVLFAFVGAAHLAGQLQQMRVQLFNRVCGIRISEDLLERHAPATPATLDFVQRGSVYEARSAR